MKHRSIEIENIFQFESLVTLVNHGNAVTLKNHYFNHNCLKFRHFIQNHIKHKNTIKIVPHYGTNTKFEFRCQNKPNLNEFFFLFMLHISEHFHIGKHFEHTHLFKISHNKRNDWLL